MDKLPSLNEISVIFGSVIAIVLAVYFKIRGLEKENTKLKREDLNEDLGNIKKEIDLASPDELVDRANDYWKTSPKRRSKGNNSHDSGEDN